MKVQKSTKNKERYVIADDNGKVVDDALGWGYKTFKNAQKALWYKFKNGKEIIAKQNLEAKELAKKHKGLVRFIDDFYTYGIKELARGEITNADLIRDIDEKFGIKLSVSQIGKLCDLE